MGEANQREGNQQERELARLARNLGGTTTPRRRFGMVRVPMCEDLLTNWVVEGPVSSVLARPTPVV